MNRRFLDYRIPVLVELDRISGHRLSVMYSSEAMPLRVVRKLRSALGERAIGLSGELKAGGSDRETMANSRLTLRYQPGLYKRMLETSPDVVVGEGLFKWTAPAVVAKLIHRIPLVVCYERTAHTERHAQWYRVLYRKQVIRLLDAMCCNGSLCADYAMSLGMPRNRIFTGHMAADTEHLSGQVRRTTVSQVQKLRSQWNVDGALFLYVGQLIPRKGIRELLKAWQSFEAKENPHRNATLVLVGDGPQRHKLEDMCRTTGLKRVRWVGRVDYSDVARWYAAADFFVIPTLEDNWSLVVPEAMACGLPILSSIYNGCWPELIRQGQNGWLFDPFDPNAVYDALCIAMDHRDRLSDLRNASKHISKDFSPARAARSIYNACRSSLTRMDGHRREPRVPNPS